MFKSDDTMLMIASSSENSPFPGGSEIIQPQGDQRGVPLKGVKYDMVMFKKKFKDYNFYYIETSKDCKILLPREHITNWLAQKFETANYDVYLFYSGHGHQNGDWAVETVENPEGDRLSFKELSQIWIENRKSKQSHLYIFMDSCYSGSWCIEAGDQIYTRQEQKKPSLNISVFAACQWGKKSTSMKDSGGLFSRCILSNENHLQQQEIDLLFSKQTPYFLNGGTKAERLKPQHIKMLYESITKAPKITNRSQGQALNQQEKKRKQKQQEELKQIIMEIAEVDSWIQLSTKKQLWVCCLEKLPDQMGNLTQLTQLRLFENQLREVPNIITNLTNLQHLSIVSSQLKQLPYNIGKLTNLRNLYLLNNKLKQVPESIGKLANLQLLILDSNQLKQLPESIGQLTNLQKLGLSDNRLKKLPDSIMRLTNLKYLYIEDNQLSVFPSWIGKLWRLEQLVMYGNNMMVNIRGVMSLIRLKELYMREYQLNSEQQVKLKQHCQQRKVKLAWYD